MTFHLNFITCNIIIIFAIDSNHTPKFVVTNLIESTFILKSMQEYPINNVQKYLYFVKGKNDILKMNLKTEL